jgi:predicted nicotinamide N-methyase
MESVLARVVQAEPAWVRGQTMLDPGCGSGVAGIAAYDKGVSQVRMPCEMSYLNP